MERKFFNATFDRSFVGLAAACRASRLQRFSKQYRFPCRQCTSRNSRSGTEPEPEPEPYTILDPTVMPEGGVRDGVTYAAYDGIVEHLFFHPVVAYPELAFDGDAQPTALTITW